MVRYALHSDHSSCHKATANQFRLFLHSGAYQVIHALRENILKVTKLTNAQFYTIRLHLLKIVQTKIFSIYHNTSLRRIYISISKNFY